MQQTAQSFCNANHSLSHKMYANHIQLQVFLAEGVEGVGFLILIYIFNWYQYVLVMYSEVKAWLGIFIRKEWHMGILAKFFFQTCYMKGWIEGIFHNAPVCVHNCPSAISKPNAPLCTCSKTSLELDYLQVQYVHSSSMILYCYYDRDQFFHHFHYVGFAQTNQPYILHLCPICKTLRSPILLPHNPSVLGYLEYFDIDTGRNNLQSLFNLQNI